MTNTELLNDKIDESGYKRYYIADQLSLSPYGFAKKVNNVNDFTASEIDMLCQLLSIKTLSEKEKIFFAKE